MRLSRTCTCTLRPCTWKCTRISFGFSHIEAEIHIERASVCSDEWAVCTGGFGDGNVQKLSKKDSTFVQRTTTPGLFRTIHLPIYLSLYLLAISSSLDIHLSLCLFIWVCLSSSSSRRSFKPLSNPFTRATTSSLLPDSLSFRVRVHAYNPACMQVYAYIFQGWNCVHIAVHAPLPFGFFCEASLSSSFS